MKRSFHLVAALGLACALLVLAQAVYADGPSPAPAPNTAVVEVTVNSAGELSVGGVSLKALGVAPIDATTVQMVRNLDSAHLNLQGDVVTLDVHGSPVAKMQWTKSSRAAVADLAAKYGYAVSPDVLGRVEEWISSSNIDLTARYTNDLSKPATISLSKPVLVDVSAQGQVAIEKGPLAYGIDPSVLASIRQSGVQNALLCWSKGTLSIKADGKDLPSLTLDPKGVSFLTQSLGLALGNIDPAFSSTLGADVSLAGAAHPAGAACGQ